MKNSSFLSLALLAGFVSWGYASGPGQETVPADVKAIIGHSCSVSGCHRGRFPTGNLNLEPDKILASTLNVPSGEAPDRKYVDTADPEKSYLLAKIKGQPGIVGARMPAQRDPLADDQIKAIEAWIQSLKGSQSAGGDSPRVAGGSVGGGQAASARKGAARKPAFWGTRIINLPTAETIDKRGVLFRVSHRFFPPLSIGEDGAYGLDGPAFVLLSLGYAITDRFMITVGRTNLNQEWEAYADYRLFELSESSAVPLSGTLHVGASLVGVDKPEGEVWASRFRFSALFSLSWKVTDRLSLLAVPGFASNTNFMEPDSEGTFSLGLGGRVLVFDDLSIIGEWVPVLAGYKIFGNGWGLGLEKKIGGHVFQVFVNNYFGLTAAQFLPGGDLGQFQTRFFDRMRFGFNIFRTF